MGALVGPENLKAVLAIPRFLRHEILIEMDRQRWEERFWRLEDLSLTDGAKRGIVLKGKIPKSDSEYWESPERLEERLQDYHKRAYPYQYTEEAIEARKNAAILAEQEAELKRQQEFFRQMRGEMN